MMEVLGPRKITQFVEDPHIHNKKGRGSGAYDGGKGSGHFRCHHKEGNERLSRRQWKQRRWEILNTPLSVLMQNQPDRKNYQ
jgi:hypothetical protein